MQLQLASNVKFSKPPPVALLIFAFVEAISVYTSSFAAILLVKDALLAPSGMKSVTSSEALSSNCNVTTVSEP